MINSGCIFYICKYYACIIMCFPFLWCKYCLWSWLPTAATLLQMAITSLNSGICHGYQQPLYFRSSQTADTNTFKKIIQDEMTRTCCGTFLGDIIDTTDFMAFAIISDPFQVTTQPPSLPPLCCCIQYCCCILCTFSSALRVVGHDNRAAS